MEKGTYGAKVQSWTADNPRDILYRIITENPSADKSTLLAITTTQLNSPENKGHLDSVIEYWFANNYHSLVERPAPAKPLQVVRSESRQAVATVKQNVKKRIMEEAKILLLDTVVLANGKTLRHSTGSECAQTGGWLLNIASSVSADQTVGDVMTEDQVREVFNQSV